MKSIFIPLLTFIITGTGACAEQKLKAFEDKKTKLFGFKDSKGHVVVSPQFEMVGEPSEGEELIPVVKNHTFMRMDTNGHIRFESVFFDNAWDYYEDGLSRFLRNGKVGFHDEKGKIIVKPEYDFAAPFKNGHSLVCNGCWAYYPKSPKFQPLSSGGSYVVKQEEYMTVTGGKWGVIDTKGEVVVPLEYDDSEEALAQISEK